MLSNYLLRPIADRSYLRSIVQLTFLIDNRQFFVFTQVVQRRRCHCHLSTALLFSSTTEWTRRGAMRTERYRSPPYALFVLIERSESSAGR